MRRIPRTLTEPLVDNNPVAVQLLGLCSALAVTRSVDTALAMSAALTVVLVSSNAIISLLRRVIPHSTRLVLQIIIIATLVTLADQLLAAFAPAMSRRLSIFVSLIITNCVVLGRAEAFAMSHGVLASVGDGLGNALGYTFLLTLVGAVRELLGAGTLLGHAVLPLARDGGWFEPMQILHQAPSGFFLIAAFVWLLARLRLPPARPNERRAGADGGAP